MKKITILITLILTAISCSNNSTDPKSIKGKAEIAVSHQKDQTASINYTVTKKDGNLDGFVFGKVTLYNGNTELEKNLNAYITVSSPNEIYVAIKDSIHATNDGTPFLEYKNSSLTLYKEKLSTKNYKSIDKIIIQ